MIGGVDCHSLAHHAAALDGRGRRLGACAFPATRAGYADLIGWLRRYGEVEAVGVESTGAYAAGLSRALPAPGSGRRGQPAPSAHAAPARQVRPHRRRGGRAQALSGEATAVPKDTTGAVEAIRLLRVARASAVKARTAAVNQLDELLVTAPGRAPGAGARSRPCAGRRPAAPACAPTPPAWTSRCRRPSSPSAALAQRVRALDAEIAELDPHLPSSSPRPRRAPSRSWASAPATPASCSSPPAQNLDRLRSEAAFAHLCGAAPIPASSGKTVRHRLTSAATARPTRALHMIAVCRLRYCDRAPAPTPTRRTAEGRTKREILRCLKRYIAREIYHALRADLAPAHPDRGTRRVARQPSLSQQTSGGARHRRGGRSERSERRTPDRGLTRGGRRPPSSNRQRTACSQGLLTIYRNVSGSSLMTPARRSGSGGRSHDPAGR